jgi:rare lipoprotein A
MARQRAPRVLAAILAASMLGPSAGAAGAAAADADPLPGAPSEGVPAQPGKVGLASIVRDRLEGHTTASGELYNRNALAAAHRSLPFGTLVRVTNLQNRRSVLVRINDRASAVGNRVIDLTPRAGAAIGLIGISTAEVKLDVIGLSATRAAPPEDRDPGKAVK